MLKIDSLTLERDNQLLAYNFEIKEGQILAIQGRSGVGKTSLFNAIAGFLKPRSGDILWRGESLLKLAVEQRPVSLLFQDINLFEHLSVKENLCLGFSGDTPYEQLLEAAAQLDVDQQLNKRPGELSGGQRQRIALIRTLLRPEPLVLLDEPFAELDPHTRELATAWVRNTAKASGKTILMVTHQTEDVDRMADSSIELKQAVSQTE
ncbi:ATP-binding cassette domain-containing protein [Amphritea balenae]|uniref:ATP-binding cassette domain-containing protein n=1 Tax=Amphritea balenae TaxID=452629 RepID=A0A3P1SQS5_9GAMM|nr:ATP-binding cassette domain-containing protein [Amphritea balenae]RRC99591.1 ATP-binding cassette domain-containing protein [Amphritea balenae]GGK78287.1 thiamine import ATP-binding protein ThiQ [Amphritea balenae]